MKQRYALGIDIGGSGVKGAIVDLKKGELATDRLRIPTPQPATLEAVAGVVKEIVDHFAPDLAKGAVGITVPSVVRHGVTLSAANIDQSWINATAQEVLAATIGREVLLVNDADAAGLAEVVFGAAKNQPGLVVVTTLGTGIGTALIHDGVLIPNAELGHLEIGGVDAETEAAASVRQRLGLSYAEWAPRLQRFYSTLESLVWPDLIVVGGGVSKNSDKFLPMLSLATPIVPAQLRNAAGIVGAAWLAVDRRRHPDPLVRG